MSNGSNPGAPRVPDSQVLPQSAGLPPGPRPDADLPTEIPPPAPAEDNPGRETPDESPSPDNEDEIRRSRARQRLEGYPLGNPPD